MVYNSVSSKWEPRSNLLDTLTNVDTTGKLTGDRLEWNGASSKWNAVSPAGAIPLQIIDINCTTSPVSIATSTGAGTNYTSVSNRTGIFGNGIPVGL